MNKIAWWTALAALFTVSKVVAFQPLSFEHKAFGAAGLTRPAPVEPIAGIQKVLSDLVARAEGQTTVPSPQKTASSAPRGTIELDPETIRIARSVSPGVLAEQILLFQAENPSANGPDEARAIDRFADRFRSREPERVAAAARMLFAADVRVHELSSEVLWSFQNSRSQTAPRFNLLTGMLDGPNGDRLAIWLFARDPLTALEMENENWFERTDSPDDPAAIAEYQRVALNALDIRYNFDRARILTNVPVRWNDEGNAALTSLCTSDVWWQRAAVAALNERYGFWFFEGAAGLKPIDSESDPRVRAVVSYLQEYERLEVSWNWCGTP